jgi:hypothetical protein
MNSLTSSIAFGRPIPLRRSAAVSRRIGWLASFFSAYVDALLISAEIEHLTAHAQREHALRQLRID